MIIDFDRTVSYMCPACGEMAFGTFSLFELSGERGISVKCGCGKSHLNIFPKSKTRYAISLKCLICDTEHTFDVRLIDLMKQDLLDFVCPDILVGLVFIGKRELVEASVKENQTYVQEIVAACGLMHTGKNGITMLKALEKIQELSENGCLTCECGSTTVDIDVLEDEIILECCKCGAQINFSSNEIRSGNFSNISEIFIHRTKGTDQEENE